MDSALLEKLRELANRLFPPCQILAAYAHGSRVSGRPRPDSDLDIGYYRDHALSTGPLPLQDEMRLAVELGAPLALNVDLRCLDGAPLELRGRVLVEGVRIFSGDAVRRVALERETLSRYQDYREVFANMHRVRLRGRQTAGAN